MISWKEKLRLTHKAATITPELSIVFSDRQAASDHFLDSLKRRFPSIDREYIAFLRETDGIQIDMYQLFGSEQSGFTSISEGIQRWAPIIGSDGVPIGEDPSGDCIVLMLDGQVRLVDKTMDHAHDGRVLADSFSDFITQVLMGPLFPTLFPNGWTPDHENEWTQYLRQQSWL